MKPETSEHYHVTHGREFDWLLIWICLGQIGCILYLGGKWLGLRERSRQVGRGFYTPFLRGVRHPFRTSYLRRTGCSEAPLIIASLWVSKLAVHPEFFGLVTHDCDILLFILVNFDYR